MSGSKSLQLPVSTRCNSTLSCLDSVFVSKYALREICVKAEVDSVIDPDIKRLILADDIFWQNVDCLRQVLRPINIWIIQLQSDCPLLSSVLSCFQEIADCVDSPLTTYLSPIVRNPLLKSKSKKEGIFVSNQFTWWLIYWMQILKE